MQYILALFLILDPARLRIHAADLESSISELDNNFQTFYRETIVEFKKLKTSVGNLENKVGNVENIPAAIDSLRADFQQLKEVVVQNREDLKALNEFALNQAGFHHKPSKGYLYSGSKQSGSVTGYNMEGSKIYSKCQNVVGPINSVHTQNGCLRLYSEENCRGLNMMAVPGIYNHNHLFMTVLSVGPCTFDTARLRK